MLIEQVIYDVKTGETRIEEIEVEDVIEELEPIQPPTTEERLLKLESNVTSYMITQNRLMLASRYNADTVSFKVDVATLRNSFEYDNDLYELILNNILVGKDNYNREYIENLIIFYWMDFVISDEMYSTLFEIIEEQHNPKIEEETPLI